MNERAFQKKIWDYYRAHGRPMPWRRTRDPYRILVSEIMLQQTQVARVMKFYPEFVKKFPDFRALARARTASVLRAWQGLGYNRRALALQKIAREVLHENGGRLPRERAALEALPGIGKATAGSLRAFIWNESEIFIETNIRRVFIHFFFSQRARVTDEELARYIKRTLPKKNIREWYWALMDYGAMLGTVTRGSNPNQKSSAYKKASKFKGSDRELRGRLLRAMLAPRRRRESLGAIAATLKAPLERVRRVRGALVKEGFIKI